MIPAEKYVTGTRHFYTHLLQTLAGARLPFLVGGTYAFNCYVDFPRTTKDLDLFLDRRDYERIAATLRKEGYEVELAFPHWLAKVKQGDTHVDLIFSSGNGIAEVDERWFEYATEGVVLGVPVLLLPAEEMIWSKAFIMERERYDGADVAHLIKARAMELDWQRLLQRFGIHWRVLFSHLLLFGFIYPDERDLIPQWVLERLLHKLRLEKPAATQNLCNGTLLSREQYLGDMAQGYEDGRLFPYGMMSAKDIASWTQAIEPHENGG